MAISYMRHGTISRTGTRSICGAIAYITRSRIEDQRDSITHDYTRGVRALDSDCVGCVGWQGDPASLAHTIDRAETRKNSRTGHDFVLALPKELTDDQQRGLLKSYALALSTLAHEGQTPLAYARHTDKGNPHAHIIMADRISDDGRTLGKKARSWSDQKTGPELCKDARALWVEMANQHLKAAGHKGDLTTENPEGVRPEMHMGPKAAAMEKKGVKTRVGNFNRNVRAAKALTARRQEMEKQAPQKAAQPIPEPPPPEAPQKPVQAIPEPPAPKPLPVQNKPAEQAARTAWEHIDGGRDIPAMVAVQNVRKRTETDSEAQATLLRVRVQQGKEEEQARRDFVGWLRRLPEKAREGVRGLARSFGLNIPPPTPPPQQERKRKPQQMEER